MAHEDLVADRDFWKKRALAAEQERDEAREVASVEFPAALAAEARVAELTKAICLLSEELGPRTHLGAKVRALASHPVVARMDAQKPGDEKGVEVTIPRPQIHTGPKGMTVDEATRAYLFAAAERVRTQRYWGSGVTTLVSEVLENAARALTDKRT